MGAGVNVLGNKPASTPFYNYKDMLNIIITTKDGREFLASEHDIILDHWQNFEPTEFLKNYLLRNLPVYAKEEGLEDEPVKVLKKDGKTIWSEGDLEAFVDGNKYSVTGKAIPEEIKPYNPTLELPDTTQKYIDKLIAQSYYEGYKAGVQSTNVTVN